MNELYLAIAQLFLVKETWTKYSKYVDLEFLRANFQDLFKLFVVLNRAQEQSNEPSLTLGSIHAQWLLDYPRESEAKVVQLLDGVRSATPSESTDRVLTALRNRASATEIALRALEVAEGKRDVQELYNLTKAFTPDKHEEEVSDQFVTDDLEQLYNKAYGEGGLKWRLASLNRSLGPLRKGDFGFIFARPETGKTTFIADQVTYMAEQCHRSVLWFNNEEQGDKVKLRIYEAALGANLEQIARAKDRAQRSFLDKTGGRILLKDDSSISRQGIEHLCRQYTPDLVVIDQLDKVRGFDADRDDLKLGSIYQWARELAKSFAPVIGVCQANGSAEGVKYLTMGHVANALTSKQAEADWILGIGFDYTDPAPIRGFSICKNKLLGGPDSVPNLRHGRFDTALEPEIARYRDLQ